MPTYEVEAGGKRYQIEAPDEAGLMNAVKSLGGEQAAPAPAPAAPQEDNSPWYSKLGRAADDMVRIGANAATFGYADKLAGYAGGEGTEAERAKTQGARDRAGSAAYAGDVLGGVAGMGIGNAAVGAIPGVAKVGAAVGNMLPKAGVGGLMARTAGMAGQGAAYGALDATGHDTDVGQGALVGALAGGAGNVAGEAVSAGVNKVAGAFNKQPKLPSMDDLKTQKNAAYDAADNAGVILNPDAVKGVKSKVVDALTDMGYHPKLQPKIAAVLDELDRVAGDNVTLKGYDTVRKIASGAYEPGNKANNAMVTKIVRALDDAPIENNVLAGDAAGIAKLKEARGLNSRVAKGETVDFAMDKAARNAAGEGSGGNIDNRIRQQFRSILNSPSKSRGFSKDEIQAMEEVVAGTPTRNAARLLGKLSPSGNGLMAAMQLGAAGATGGASIPLAAVGMGAKKLAEKSTNSSVDDLVRIIAAGGKKSDAFAAPNVVQRLSQTKRDALIKALMAGGLATTH